MTTKQLADILVRAGLVEPQAVDDPEGFDNYVTVGQISEAALLVTAKAIDESEHNQHPVAVPQGTGSEAR